MTTLPEILACPLCHIALVNAPQPCEQCQDCYRRELTKIDQEYTFLDLTPEASCQSVVKKPLRTNIFQNPLISFFYERILPPIWAVGLRNWGGIEREVREVKDFFSSEPDIVLDLSCGTGLMARQLALSGHYQQVIALDYSQEMLTVLQQQTLAEGICSSQILRLRGDVESLPLLPNSVDAIYAGAALHCWPDAQTGMNNLYQILRAGGKFYGTTFLKPWPSLVFRFFTLEELRQILCLAGFQPSSIQLTQHGLYGVMRGIK